jgi:hypothetical protein
MTIEDTIDAFVDGETVDTSSLDAALASPEGRAYLIDALALRRLVDSTLPQVEAPRAQPARVLMFAKAAALALAFAGIGYAAGLSQDAAPAAPPATLATDQTLAPPEPTRVIELTPGVNWHESKGGD